MSTDLSPNVETNRRQKLISLALSHDREASFCPWAQLSRRTAAYPSRVAQAALLVAAGAVSPSPDLVDQLYRCDDCGLCRAHSILPDPPDLARTLWEVRASLMAASAVSEVAPLAAALSDHGTIYGNLQPAFKRLGPGDAGARILYVPGAATLFFDFDAAVAALRAARVVSGSVDLSFDAIDSGQTPRELGLREEAARIRERLRELVRGAGYRLVVAATPKETFGLREALAGLPAEVFYAGSLVARSGCLSASSRGSIDAYDSIVFHPSETLIHRLDDFDEIDRWLSIWLGDVYRPEPAPMLSAWPAAIERPAIRVPVSLTRALARTRMTQLQKVGRDTAGSHLVLTSDPYSLRALRDVAPPNVVVRDLLDVAFGREDEAGG